MLEEMLQNFQYYRQGPGNLLGKKLSIAHKIKNETNYMGFCIPKIWQILKCFARTFSSSINLLFLKNESLSARKKRVVVTKFLLQIHSKKFGVDFLKNKFFWLLSIKNHIAFYKL